MAAPVRIETSAWDDPRYAVLAKLAGLADRDHALIKCGRVWSLCTDRDTRVLSVAIIDAHVNIDGFADFLVESELAQRTAKGIRICGAKGRTEWLGERKKAGQLGGVASGSKRSANAKQAIRNRQADKEQAPSKEQASSSLSSSALPLPLPQREEIREESECEGVAQRSAPRLRPVVPRPASATWDAYSQAYEARYGEPPVRNARVNSQLAQFVKRVPEGEAPAIAAAYLRSQNARYVAAGHSVGCLLADAEKLRTEAVTGRSGTARGAHQADKQAGRAGEYAELFAQLDAEDAEKRRIANDA